MSMKKPKESSPGLTRSALAARPSSSEVIKEAKQWCALKSIQTKRPSTPRDARSLYGGSERAGSRPPSTSYSLGPQFFDPLDDSSRPNSSAGPLVKPKLAPLPRKPVVPANREPKIISKATQRRRSSATVGKPVSPGQVDTSFAKPSSGGSRVEQNGGSGGGRGEETADEAFYWNQSVLPLVERLGGFLDRQSATDDVAEMCDLCESLHAALQRGACFVRMSSRRRTSLLSVLFRLLNHTSRELHVFSSKIILSMKIRNKNLTNVCKLIFTICREGKHDDLFTRHQLLEPMLDTLRDCTDPLSRYDAYEAFVYLTGSVKCLTDNKAVAQSLYKLHCLPTLAKFMSSTVNAMRGLPSSKRVRKYAESLIAQVASAFCNMLNVDQKAQQSISFLSVLLAITSEFIADREIIAVMSRTFSKLSMHPASAPEFLGEEDFCPLCLAALHKHMASADIVLHLLLVIGDVTSQNDQSRNQLFSCPGPAGRPADSPACLDILVRLMDFYLESSRGESPGDALPPASTEQANDVLVKAIRVVAHLSIGARIGPVISADADCVDTLLAVLESRSLEDSEELIVNVLAALNNLSYYGEVASCVFEHRLRLAVLLSGLMVADNMACVAEVLRVYGNLTKAGDVRDLLHEHKVDLMVLALLDSGDRVVVYNACGVMVNLSADSGKRSSLISEGSVDKVVDVMRDFATAEWRIGGVACQLLWNLSSDPTFAPDPALLHLLDELLDYPAVNSRMKKISSDAESLDFLRTTWREDFCEFAAPLSRKLRSNASNLVPLEGAIESDASSSEYS